MYNIFYIYTYKYKTVKRSHALNAHTSQKHIKQPDKLCSLTSARRKPCIYEQNTQAA